MTWMIFVALGMLTGYELTAVITHQLTLSQMVWSFSKRHPALPFAFGLLMGHLFLSVCMAVATTTMTTLALM